MNLTKPMIEKTMGEEMVELLFILGVIIVIWLIGQIIYQVEVKYQNDRDYRRSKNRGMGERIDKTDKNGKHRQELGKDRKRRKPDG